VVGRIGTADGKMILRAPKVGRKTRTLTGSRTIGTKAATTTTAAAAVPGASHGVKIESPRRIRRAPPESGSGTTWKPSPKEAREASWICIPIFAGIGTLPSQKTPTS